jgi:predicted MPP superfamily phosphohydrolase
MKNADIVLLGGDIIDNDYDVVKRQQSLLPLAKIDSKLGVSAVFGNHDYLGLSYNELASDLARMNVNVLIDKNTEYGQIRVVGLTDYSKDRSAEYLAGNLDSRKKFSISCSNTSRAELRPQATLVMTFILPVTHMGAPSFQTMFLQL